MFNLIYNICQYTIPVIGVIGFFIDNPILMIVAIIFIILQNILGYLTEQLKPGAAHIILSFILGIIISFVFRIEWYKGLTITFVFVNIFYLIFGLLLMLILKNKHSE